MLRTALTDPSFLVRAEPDLVASVLDDAVPKAVVRAVMEERLMQPNRLLPWEEAAEWEQAVRRWGKGLRWEEFVAAMVYRASLSLHRSVDAGSRRQVLAVDAARFGQPELSSRIAAVQVDGLSRASWTVRWATGFDLHGQYISGARARFVLAIATAVVDERPVAVIGCTDGSVRIWDMTTGEQVGPPRTRHADWVWGGDGDRGVCAMATAMVDGRVHAVTSGEDGTVRLWDLTTGQQAAQPLIEHWYKADSVATAVVDGRPRAVVSAGGSVRLWDLTTREPVDLPLIDNDDSVTAMATTVMNGRPVMVTDNRDMTIRVSDLSTGEQVSRILASQTPREIYNWRTTVATTMVEGRAHAVITDLERVQLWDLTTGRQTGQALTGRRFGLSALATVATVVLDGRLCAVTGDGGTVRTWDLATGEQVGGPLRFPLRVEALTVAPNNRLVVAFGHDVAVLAPTGRSVQVRTPM